MKEIKYTPIYKGIYGMTPERYESIKRAKDYSDSLKSPLAPTNVELVLLALCIGYLFIAFIR